jgi:hypothetical protein
MLVKGEPIIICNRGRGWEIQAQKDAEGSGDRRAFISLALDPRQNNPASIEIGKDLKVPRRPINQLSST